MKALLFMPLLLCSSYTYAVSDPKLCASIETLSSAVMTARQSEVPLSEMLTAIKYDPVTTEIIKLAYSQPAYSVESNKESAIARFANDMHLHCLNGTSKNEK